MSQDKQFEMILNIFKDNYLRQYLFIQLYRTFKKIHLNIKFIDQHIMTEKTATKMTTSQLLNKLLFDNDSAVYIPTSKKSAQKNNITKQKQIFEKDLHGEAQFSIQKQIDNTKIESSSILLSNYFETGNNCSKVDYDDNSLKLQSENAEAPNGGQGSPGQRMPNIIAQKLQRYLTLFYQSALSQESNKKQKEAGQQKQKQNVQPIKEASLKILQVDSCPSFSSHLQIKNSPRILKTQQISNMPSIIVILVVIISLALSIHLF